MAKSSELLALVAEQGARIAELERRLGEPATRKSPFSVVDDDAVRIITGAAARAASREPAIVLPNENELRRLGEICDAAYPTLVPKFVRDESRSRADYDRQFTAAFAWLAEMPRKNKLDTHFGADWWCDSARQWAQEAGISVDIGRHALARAVVCHRDIPFGHLRNFPFDLTFGLGLAYPDFRYSEAWRQTLSSGEAPKPQQQRGS
jgi:hypothetical protein